MSAKITDHPQRQLIDKWIADGLAFTEIEKKCKRELGLNISHMTIKRYCDGNADLAMARANALNQSGIAACNAVDDDETDSALMIDVSAIPTDHNKVKDFTRETLTQIYLNQLLIVKHKQQAFMDGKGRYPQNEIMGLKTILSCLGYVSDDKDKTLSSEASNNT